MPDRDHIASSGDRGPPGGVGDVLDGCWLGVLGGSPEVHREHGDACAGRESAAGSIMRLQILDRRYTAKHKHHRRAGLVRSAAGSINALPGGSRRSNGSAAIAVRRAAGPPLVAVSPPLGPAQSVCDPSAGLSRCGCGVVGQPPGGNGRGPGPSDTWRPGDQGLPPVLLMSTRLAQWAHNKRESQVWECRTGVHQATKGSHATQARHTQAGTQRSWESIWPLGATRDSAGAPVS
jgi:hypothetical protein